MYTDGSIDPLQLMIDAVRPVSGCMVNVITRKPLKNAEYHKNAIQLLRDNVNPLLFFCDSLHTKLYVLEADGFTAAVLGSPNLTAGGNSANIELAVEIRDTLRGELDEVAIVLSDLVRYAHELLTDDAVRLAD
jgi:phosphatidylserine/phosphatidylglycerophosphate/cardiolipin synthase-like enzyme